jgi:hypothetical protein
MYAKRREVQRDFFELDICERFGWVFRGNTCEAWLTKLVKLAENGR